jgi:two-component SAPR family response regulator
VRPPELDAVAGLLHGAAVPPTIPDEDDMQLRDDHDRTGDDTIYGSDTAGEPDGATTSETSDSTDSTTGRRPRPVLGHATVAPADDWQLLVRMLGPVEVEGRHGGVAEFERSKTKELVAWLATHRDRSTRGAARTALWEHDVRDATFANVVSEARRALARLVEPTSGEEWVGRTMTDALPLHAAVRTDAELLEGALRAARLQPPDQAIVTLSPAVERITGVPFEGTSYLWPDAEGITSSLVLLATSAAAELAAHCLSVGDVEGVFRATGRGLRVLAGHEELIGLRMRAHARVGDLAGVRSEWETYERMITADPWSDGEPSPKLVDLRTQLLNPSR